MESNISFVFSNGGKAAARFSSRANDRTLSRTERRLLERKQRNSAKRKSKMPETTEQQSSKRNNFGNKFRRILSGEGVSSFFSNNNSQGLKHYFIESSLVPRLPGRNVSFTHRSLWMALGFRLPFFIALSYVMTNENTSPYVIQGSLGPSMLPTIQFVGDIWLVETGAWKRAWRRMLGLLRQDEENLPAVGSIYEVGDLVIWEDTKTGKRSCKRIVGLEGDTVHRFGEYRNLYRSRSDVGILWPKNKEKAIDRVFGAFSKDNKEKGNDVLEHQEGTLEQSYKIVVPKQCVWLEGDCPLFSMDSRYGKGSSSVTLSS
jgi:signal peptidase I